MDNKAFERTVCMNKDRVHSYATMMLRDPTEAQDVAQETMVRLWQHRETVRLDASRSWLMRTAHNLCIDRMRRKKVRAEIEESQALIAKNREIAEIKRRGAEARLAVRRRRAENKQKELSRTTVTAETSGAATHLRAFREFMDSGRRLWEGCKYMVISDEEDVAFRGLLPETARRHLEVGDKAVLRVRANSTIVALRSSPARSGTRFPSARSSRPVPQPSSNALRGSTPAPRQQNKSRSTSGPASQPKAMS